LQLSQPIGTFGSYVLHNVLGTDGNSVQDTCFANQNTTETISFNVLGKPSALFSDMVHFGCVKDTIMLSHPGGNGVNSWQWNFSDGTSANTQSASHTFPVSTVTATVQLIVSNGICTDTLQRTYTLDNAFNADFTINVDTVCSNKAVNFNNASTGNNLQYVWLFGDLSQFVGQNPPPHAYTSSNLYTIQLVANDTHGCSDTANKKLFVTPVPSIGILGLMKQYCTAETVALSAQLQGDFSNYTWNNGNGVTVQNQPVFSFSYSAEGNYNVQLSATDRFCGPVSTSETTKIYLVPSFNVGDDQILCPGITIEIGVNPVVGYSYLWNTGATDSKTITGALSNTYRLVANNNGCIGQDEVFVKVLDNCLIKVPGAFTPNSDGLNDNLKAINADLATNFLMRVYNRMGQLVFSSSNPLYGWDGTYKGVLCESGTYVWQLSFVHPTTKKSVYEKGASLLIR
jgi:gliding motility-associated-like protein